MTEKTCAELIQDGVDTETVLDEQMNEWELFVSSSPRILQINSKIIEKNMEMAKKISESKILKVYCYLK